MQLGGHTPPLPGPPPPPPPGSVVPPPGDPPGVTCSVPRSFSTCASELKTAYSVPPPSVTIPQLTPTSEALPSALALKTGPPLSPKPELYVAHDWQRSLLCDRSAGMSTHVLTTDPRVQPVVVPTLSTTIPPVTPARPVMAKLGFAGSTTSELTRSP